jgi:hypothetical protein
VDNWLPQFRPGEWIARCLRSLGATDQRASGDRWELERPWLINWQWVPKRSAGPGFGPHDYARARARGAEVARATLGDEAWEKLRRHNYLDVRSRRIAGLTYRLRVGKRIQLVWDSVDDALRSPWPYDYLCINPTYPLPAIEYLAQLYLYVRDLEDEVIRVAAPQPFDQQLGRVF